MRRALNRFNRRSYESITENERELWHEFEDVAAYTPPYAFPAFRSQSFAGVPISRIFLQPRRRDALAANKRRRRIPDACTRVATLIAGGSLRAANCLLAATALQPDYFRAFCIYVTNSARLAFYMSALFTISVL